MKYEPWIVPESIPFIESLIGDSSPISLEFGSGGSTIWLSKLSNCVVTFEHNIEYLSLLQSRIKQYNLLNIKEIFSPSEHLIEKDELETPYYPLISELQDDCFDVVLIDGRDRVKCFELSLPKMKQQCLIILDNSDRPIYQPIFDQLAQYKHTTFRHHTDDWETTVWEKK